MSLLGPLQPGALRLLRAWDTGAVRIPWGAALRSQPAPFFTLPSPKDEMGQEGSLCQIIPLQT